VRVRAVVIIEYDEDEILDVLEDAGDISLQDEIQGWLEDSGIKVVDVSLLEEE